MIDVFVGGVLLLSWLGVAVLVIGVCRDAKRGDRHAGAR